MKQVEKGSYWVQLDCRRGQLVKLKGHQMCIRREADTGFDSEEDASLRPRLLDANEKVVISYETEASILKHVVT